MFVVVFVAVFTLWLGCKQLPKEEECVRKENILRQQTADRFNGEVVYMKDARTNLCFAFYRSGRNFAGPTFVTVPCDAIPLELLTVAR